MQKHPQVQIFPNIMSLFPCSSLPPANTLSGFRLKSVDFDKDLDPHMRVVAAVSNLRARNYRIPEADLHTSRGIAGNALDAAALAVVF